MVKYKMEIIDKHFLALSKKKKSFLMSLTLGYFFIASIAFMAKLTGLVESILIFIIGILYTELIKLQYRIEKLENKKGD